MFKAISGFINIWSCQEPPVTHQTRSSAPPPAPNQAQASDQTEASSPYPTANAKTEKDYDTSRNNPIAPTYSNRTGRPILQPKRQQDCRCIPIHSKHEKDQDATQPCGLNNKHQLACGHFILSFERCARNCKTPELDQDSFTCPTCREIVIDAIYNKIPAVEATKLQKLREKDAIGLIACCVELVTRSVPELKANIAETVGAISRKGYGRGCLQADAPPPMEQPDELATGASPKRGMKRKNFEEAINLPVDTQTLLTKVTTNINKIQHNAHDTATCNKKQKTKLQTHREPIPLNTRTTKRRSPFESECEFESSFRTHSSGNASKKPRIMVMLPGSSPSFTPTIKRAYAPIPEEMDYPTTRKKICVMPSSGKLGDTASASARRM